jgi:hypothetical protein
MRNSAPIGKNTRTTWRTDVREVAEALGIPVSPQQWVTIESAEMDEALPLTGFVDIVRWEPHQPSTYQHELATCKGNGDCTC